MSYYNYLKKLKRKYPSQPYRERVLYASYLNKKEKEQVIDWIQKQSDWDLYELKFYLIEKYNVVFKSPSSYYYLLAKAKDNWQKTKKNNPVKKPDLLDKLLHCL